MKDTKKTERRWGIKDGSFYYGRSESGVPWTWNRSDAERFTHATAETLMLAMIQAGTVGSNCRVVALREEATL